MKTSNRHDDYRTAPGAPALPKARRRKDNVQQAAKVTMEHRVITRGPKAKLATPVDPTKVHDKPSCGLLDSQKLLAKRQPKEVPVRVPGTELDFSGWPAAEQARARRWLAEAEMISKRIA